MKNAGQLFLGFLFAAGSTALVMAAASLALLEGGAVAVSAVTALPTGTTISHTPSPLAPLVETATSAFTPTITPTEEVYCKETPGDWLPYVVQQEDTIESLVAKSGADMAAFLKANCFKSAGMRLEPGWVVYLPPTAPTATATLTPTPEPPTPTYCGAPPGWVNYIVRPGDTLFRLSLILGISQYELMTANCLTDTTIYAGSILRVPFLPPVSTSTPVPTETPVDTDTPVPPTLTPIVMQDQTISFGPLADRTYGDAPFTVSATASSGLAVTFSAAGNCSAAGNTVTISGAGSCTITASQAGNASYNPAPDVSQSFTINKAAATVSLNISSPVTYDTFAHGATASTTPGGLAVTITYNGGAAEPVNAGSYSVVATVTDANYEGSASGTLVINQATATVTLNITSPVTEDGSLHGATATTTPAGLSVTITYNGSPTAPTAAGIYTVVATVVDANYLGSATGTLVINAAAPPP